MAGKKSVWITAKMEHQRRLRRRKWFLIRELAGEGLSYGDIETIIRTDRGNAYRIVKSKRVPGS